MNNFYVNYPIVAKFSEIIWKLIGLFSKNELHLNYSFNSVFNDLLRPKVEQTWSAWNNNLILALYLIALDTIGSEVLVFIRMDTVCHILTEVSLFIVLIM